MSMTREEILRQQIERQLCGVTDLETLPWYFNECFDAYGNFCIDKIFSWKVRGIVTVQSMNIVSTNIHTSVRELIIDQLDENQKTNS